MMFKLYGTLMAMINYFAHPLVFVATALGCYTQLQN